MPRNTLSTEDVLAARNILSWNVLVSSCVAQVGINVLLHVVELLFTSYRGVRPWPAIMEE